MCTSSKGWVAMIFSMEALCCFALKVDALVALKMFLACIAIQGQKKWSHIRSNILSRPNWLISSWHPLRAVSWCMAGKINWNRASWASFGRVFLYRMPYLSLRWLHSWRNCQSSGGLVSFNGLWPRVPSVSLQSQGPGPGSACWAWCQSSLVMQETCGLSPTGSRACRLQLYASVGLVGPLWVASCMSHTAAAVTWWCVPNTLGTHLGQDTPHKASTSMLVFPAL